MSLFTNDMIIHIENPKESIKKLLKLTSKFSKFTGYKANIKKKTYFYNLQ